jgi:hypothetical protein
MKKRNLLIYLGVLSLVVGCTEDFAEINTNPFQISDESLRQDNNHVGAFFPSILNNIFGDQIEHNLANESFVRHLGTPTPFVGGVNNTTYYIRWNSYWGRVYNSVMAPSRQVIQIAEAENNEVFVAWATLLRVLSTSRLSAYHGPIIYSNYGSTDQAILYDSEPDLYNTWFAQLDEIESAFTRNIDFGGMAAFDASYGGDVSGWLKLANSIRLRLAMRISKVNPSLAKTQGEKAINAAGGLISSNADNFYIKNYDGFFRPARICFGWGDTRMSATMESVLGGYQDPRVSKYFDPATDASLYATDHPDFPYKGIRNGAELVAKDDRLAYSTIASAFQTWPARRCFTSSETHFLLAEAALRGWATPMSAKEHYEMGVRESFAEWGAGGVDAYLQNDETMLPLDYDDPKASGPVNDFVSRIKVPVKWNDAGDNEYQLEQIMTQKWIAAVHNTIEIWVDHRRTGYPKLPYNYKNDSNADWGVIPADDFLRRMPFVNGERNNNPQGVADATQKLGGPDEIGTRLWWDTGGPNF